MRRAARQRRLIDHFADHTYVPAAFWLVWLPYHAMHYLQAPLARFLPHRNVARCLLHAPVGNMRRDVETDVKTFLFNFHERYLFLKTLKKSHTCIIKRQIKMTFVMQ